ncbi:MAG: hypothetical protein K2W85_09175 [Phycisphaerales bacterium]|nr:hypothetical protein [Phycisphaerales bacterium]
MNVPGQQEIRRRAAVPARRFEIFPEYSCKESIDVPCAKTYAGGTRTERDLLSSQLNSSEVVRAANVGEPVTAGGTRRFIVAAAVVTLVLAGSAFGLLWWIHVTNKTEYDGPDKIVYPEHRFYR